MLLQLWRSRQQQGNVALRAMFKGLVPVLALGAEKVGHGQLLLATLAIAFLKTIAQLRT